MTTVFTPFASLIGGCLIGLATVLLLLFHGRIAGISGIAVRLFPPYLDSASKGRFMFILGLIAAPLLYRALVGTWPPFTVEGNSMKLAVAGLLVGFGSVWGNGCTSGHGICGLARLSSRSIVAVCCFMATAMMTVFITRHVM